ncbi:TylF/MycF family methyltransferase, partial [Methylacidiphilum caldifontis]|uniref:TylF/MycF family methyltransferase n=1 Tax=Methylacidiphilum caldifontis TaxID=2795386 RepID=UPI001FC9EAE4
AGGRKQEPTEATQERCHATPERRRNLRPSGRGGCQKLSPGGFCIIDDYAMSSCKAAVDEFRKRRKISEPLMVIDWTGRYWRKGQS